MLLKINGSVELTDKCFTVIAQLVIFMFFISAA